MHRCLRELIAILMAVKQYCLMNLYQICLCELDICKRNVHASWTNKQQTTWKACVSSKFVSKHHLQYLE